MASDKTDKTDKTPTKSRPQPIDFRGAVDMVKQYLTEQRYDEAGRDLYSGAELNDAINAKIAPLFSGPRMVGSLKGSETQIVDFSECFDLSDPLQFDVCREMLAGKIEAGEPIPLRFHDLAAALVRGQAKGPKRKEGDKGTGILHSRIVFTIMLLVERGLNATRNDYSAKEESACDAVALALSEMSLKPQTFGGVKRVWLSREANSFVVQIPD